MVQAHKEKLLMLEDTKKAAQLASRMDALEISRLKSKIADYDKSKLAEIETLKRQHSREMDTLVERLKREAFIVVYQAMIKRAQEAADKGYDTSIWKVGSWESKLEILKKENPGTSATVAEPEALAIVTLEDGAGKGIKDAEARGSRMLRLMGKRMKVKEKEERHLGNEGYLTGLSPSVNFICFCFKYVKGCGVKTMIQG